VDVRKVWARFEKILKVHGATTTKVDSEGINAMTTDQLEDLRSF